MLMAPEEENYEEPPEALPEEEYEDSPPAPISAFKPTSRVSKCLIK